MRYDWNEKALGAVHGKMLFKATNGKNSKKWPWPLTWNDLQCEFSLAAIRYYWYLNIDEIWLKCNQMIMFSGQKSDILGQKCSKSIIWPCPLCEMKFQSKHVTYYCDLILYSHVSVLILPLLKLCLILVIFVDFHHF